MKAIRIHSRGGPEALVYEDAPVPKIAKGDALIRVHATKYATKYGVRGVSFLVQPNRTQLTQISQLIDEGTVRPIVEGVYPLSRAREAYERGLQGHNRGKLVLQVSTKENQQPSEVRV